LPANYLTNKKNEDHYDCLNNETTTLLKNMADALDFSKRYYEQLKRKTLDQKTMKKVVGCESLVQYLKKNLKQMRKMTGKIRWIGLVIRHN
jgi:hypothetical protein